MAQGNNYLSKNINATSVRYDNSRLGGRTIYSHSVDGKRYFSSLDSEIYIGETYVDTIVQITWAVEQATMPIFGYNSYVFDDLAVGARQVSGSFVINFTKSRFLYDILKNVSGVSRSSLYAPADINDNSKLEWTSTFAKEHTAAWNRNFNIRIGYGDQTKGGTDTSLIQLHCVQITGCQQVIGVDGSPIGEVYSFIAKDIRYDSDGTAAKDTTEKTEATKSVEEAESENFKFEIKSLYIERRSNKNDHYSTQGIPYSYKIKMEYDCSNGDVTGINFTLKTLTWNKINCSAWQIGTTSPLEFEIPFSVATKIDNAIKSQNVSNIADARLYCDITINNQKDDKIKSPKRYHNQKISIKDK